MRGKRRLIGYWYVWLQCLSLGSMAQEKPSALAYHQEHFTDASGLPQNSVKTITQDAEGFIWLATEGGLVRYDGRVFKIYDRTKLPLPSDRILTLFNQGPRLYALTQDKAYVRIENRTARIDTNFEKTLDRQPFLRAYVTARMATGVTDQFVPIQADESYGLAAGQQTYYLYRRGRVECCQAGQKTRSFATRAVAHLGRLFCLDQQLYYWNPSGTFTWVRPEGSVPEELRGDIRHHPAYRHHKHECRVYWNPLTGQGAVYLREHLYRLTRSASGALHTQLLLSQFDCVAEDIGSFYYHNATGSIFLGSKTRGLYVFSRQYFSSLVFPSSASDNVYYAQVPFQGQTVLSAQGNILGLTPPAGSIRPLLKRLTRTDNKSLLIRDQRKNLWVKDRTELYCLNPEGTQMKGRWQAPDVITGLYAGADGRIWVGVRNVGLFTLNPRQTQPRLALFQRMALQRMSVLVQESKDYLWLGTGKGLYRVQLSQRRLDTLLQDTPIRSLYLRRPGELWGTTDGQGFFLLKQGKYTSFPLDAHFYLRNAHCLVQDQHGCFWIPTNKGLFQTSIQQLLHYAAGKTEKVYYRHYDTQDGLLTNEFNGGCQPCGLLLPNGYISLPSLQGMVWFNPDKIPSSSAKQPLFIDRLAVNRVPLSVRDTLYVKSGRQFLELDLISPYAGNLHALAYEYRLEEPNAEVPPWETSYTDQLKLLHHFSAGSCWLVIRQVDGMGRPHLRKRLLLIIEPLWYELGWVRLGLVVLLAVAIQGLVHLRTRLLERNNKVLRLHVARQTRQLRHTLRELESFKEELNWQMIIQDRFLKVISHDVRTPLKYLHRVSRLLREGLEKEPTKPDLLETSRTIEQSSAQSYRLMDSLLASIKAQMEPGMEQPVDVSALIAAKVALFLPIAEANQTRLLNTVPAGLWVKSNQVQLEIILHNVLDNAVKACWEGLIQISTEPWQEGIRLFIEDTGGGMPQALVEWINSERNRQELSRQTPVGLGLVLIKEFTHSLKIPTRVRSHSSGTIWVFDLKAPS
ncbi:hypothetical protein C5O19_18595 [Siphonobacter curvatus]|uniref:histidine kinase n=2 Tax=Siphonobacter curvatus TaxID=2094562 RepID=A0A2S7IIY4_9BACT|nr:hypothetical protein C5O19_18595 [Siphonobacter curvatus]